MVAPPSQSNQEYEPYDAVLRELLGPEWFFLCLQLFGGLPPGWRYPVQSEQIEVNDNKEYQETRKYKNVDDVPPDMRDQVRDLIKLTEMGAGTTEPEKKR